MVASPTGAPTPYVTLQGRAIATGPDTNSDKIIHMVRAVDTR
jgi:hypothetical protein